MLFAKNLASVPFDGKLKIATWNVNSIRARIDMFLEWMEREKIDVALLQETKCTKEQFPFDAVVSAGLNVQVVGQKSYNGVAIVSRFPLEVEMEHLPLYGLWPEDNEARYLEASFMAGGRFFRVASVYVPNGGSVLKEGECLEDSERFRYKIAFYERLKKRVGEISLLDEYVILGGDFNVAQEEIDLARPKENAGNIGFHDLERQGLMAVCGTGVADCFRYLKPNEVAYSWFDFKTRAVERNIGWRLDYLLASESVLGLLSDCYMDIETRRLPKPSDHASVVCEIRLGV